MLTFCRWQENFFLWSLIYSTVRKGHKETKLFSQPKTFGWTYAWNAYLQRKCISSYVYSVFDHVAFDLATQQILGLSFISCLIRHQGNKGSSSFLFVLLKPRRTDNWIIPRNNSVMIQFVLQNKCIIFQIGPAFWVLVVNERSVKCN